MNIPYEIAIYHIIHDVEFRGYHKKKNHKKLASIVVCESLSLDQTLLVGQHDLRILIRNKLVLSIKSTKISSCLKNYPKLDYTE